ncbi:MAG TPA: hypothetical protein VE713_08435 [Pyrinomonadaceae bacterium]|nr:hypothetical protein [Pyrinomonadaceae bacterium]
MRRYSLALALVAISFAASGATSPARAGGVNLVEPKTTSPYEIARLVNQSAAQGKEGYVADEVDLRRTWKRLGVPPRDFETCPGYCGARIFRYELDGERGDEVLLKLNRGVEFFRYLVFKRAGRGRWRLLGFVDHDFNRYEESSHRVLRAGGRNWLVIRGQEGSGSGFALYAETWYEVSAKGLRPVLYYPVKGQAYPWPEGVGRKFKARITSTRGAAKAVRLLYTVSYERLDYMKNEFVKLYRNHHQVQYVWNGRRRRFVFDAPRSNITEKEIEAIAELQVEMGEGERIGGSEFFSEGDAWKRGGYDLFLKYNLRSLLKLARGADEGQKEWLRQLLKDCADTREKRLLEGALREQR